jgi:hypothetical protein
MKKTVAFVLSTNYAGSHYLSLMLGSHPAAAHLGEVKVLRKRSLNPEKRYCFLCGTLDRCPVFQGISPENIERVYDIVFYNLPPAVRVVIDISKKPLWAGRYLSRDDFSRKYIHLIRDPRALIRRWLIMPEKKRWKLRLKLAGAYPGCALSLLAGRWWFVFLYKWLQQNREITFFLQRNGLDFSLVPYVRLAAAPSETVQALSEWLGLSFTSGQLSYWNSQHHGTRKKEYEWIKEHKGFYHDLRWRKDLPAHIQRSVTENTRVSTYLEKLGLCFSDKGLVPKGLPAG